MVARAVAFRPEIGKYWPNGKVLKVRFLGGTEADRAKVRKYATEWSEVANIRFLFIEKGSSDLRVSFTSGLGTWSLIGTDASLVPQDKATINFGWFNARLPESDCRAAVLHEFGHVLGFPDCYVEFFDSRDGLMVNYYIDTSNLMCSRSGQVLPTHYEQLKTTYSRLQKSNFFDFLRP